MRTTNFILIKIRVSDSDRALCWQVWLQCTSYLFFFKGIHYTVATTSPPLASAFMYTYRFQIQISIRLYKLVVPQLIWIQHRKYTIFFRIIYVRFFSFFYPLPPVYCSLWIRIVILWLLHCYRWAPPPYPSRLLYIIRIQFSLINYMRRLSPKYTRASVDICILDSWFMVLEPKVSVFWTS